MPLHALVTRPPRRPVPAAALARDRVTRLGERPPRGTLTFLAAASRRLRAAAVTCGAPARGERERFWERFTDFASEISQTVVVAFDSERKRQTIFRMMDLSQYFPSYPSGQAVHL